MPIPVELRLLAARPLRHIDRRGVARLVCLIVVASLAAACAQTKAYTHTTAAVMAGKDARVLLMPTDIELSELAASGLLEPQAAWTEAGRNNVHQALLQIFSETGQQVLHFEEAPGSRDDGAAGLSEDSYLQILKLHEAVGVSILAHKYTPVLALPTKKDSFDWSLGGETVALGEHYEADYALFVYMRDSFSSDGRVALNVVAALLGAPIRGGQQLGFASLVDLKSGDVVWFNTLASQYGDLREAESARSACESLLDQFPI